MDGILFFFMTLFLFVFFLSALRILIQRLQASRSRPPRFECPLDHPPLVPIVPLGCSSPLLY